MCIVASLAGLIMVILVATTAKCLVNLALMRHSLMDLQFGAGDLG